MYILHVNIELLSSLMILECWTELKLEIIVFHFRFFSIRFAWTYLSLPRALNYLL